jgi:hypothetical protein
MIAPFFLARVACRLNFNTVKSKTKCLLIFAAALILYTFLEPYWLQNKENTWAPILPEIPGHPSFLSLTRNK